METEDHHLVRPSATTPWDAQVVSLIPESVHTLRTKKKAQTTQGVMEQGWTCVCISSRLYLWNSTQNCHCLYHPSLKCARDQPDQVKLSLTVEETSVHVFAIHPIRGFLGVWVVPIAGPKQKRVSLMPKSPQAKVTIDLQEGDVVTCLKAINPQMAIIGTRQSKIYCARVSVRPVLIQVQPWSRSSGSMWSLVFGNSTSKEMPIVDVVVSSNDTFYAVSITGVVEPWSKGGQSGTPVNLASLVANVAPLGLRVVQVSMLDSTMDLIVKVVKEGRRSRIYWFRVSFEDQPTVLQSVFLDRFHDRVTCTGLVTADNGIAYAAFESDGDNTTPVVVVGLMDGEKELDLPNKYVPSVLVLGKDVVTHGCTMVSSEGLMVRARCIQLQQTSPQHKTPHTEAIAATTTLANHLRATFWHAYEHSISAIQLPPSLQSASPEQIDPTVLLTAQRLQQENGSKLAWHLAFIDMTQQCGLYRQLSIPSRWQLLGVGQELAVHHKLVASEPFRQLDTFHVAKKMLSIQQHILDYSPVDIPRWTEGLVKALTVAKSFRDEKSASTYDAFTNPCNVWTHSKELQTVLRNQLDLVHNGKAKKDGLETIVRAALLSFQETRHQDYEAIKQLAIPMIEDDVVAFELSKQHAWYEGLCQLALKHPENSTFDLKPILRENVHEGVRQFVLQWHTDQGKVGHVFRYGEVLPDAEFEDFLAKTPRLEPYRWMQAIKMEKFDAATDLLISDSHEASTTADAQFSLSLAKLACKVSEEPMMVDDDNVEADRPLSNRRKWVDSKLDLIRAQQILMTLDGEDDREMLSSARLLSMAFEKLPTHEPPLDMAVVCLSIAKADLAENPESTMMAQVWCRILQQDWGTKWNRWLEDATRLPSRDVILDETLFGAVWKAMQEQSMDHHVVQFDSNLEPVVLKLLGQDNNVDLKRMLQSVITVNISRSLLVASM